MKGIMNQLVHINGLNVHFGCFGHPFKGKLRRGGKSVEFSFNFFLLEVINCGALIIEVVIRDALS